ncbi:hypothetical protein AFLA70_245g001961 [Aspergillus flavus AF70]|nr:hypothetical protein AFLA70_245g001961 [Aspergillus flavus AF70]
MIVLRNANAPFAVSELPSPAITEEPTTDPFAESITTTIKRIICFKASLTGGGKENITFCQQGSVEMTTEGWNLEAFLILLKIIHGQAHDLPQKLSFRCLVRLLCYLTSMDARGP